MQEPLKLNKEALSALISANVTVFGHDYGTKQVKASWLKRRKQIINSVDDADDYKNYHIITGDNNTTDIDIDCEEGIILAPHFLPATNMKYGRQSNPTSHWLYKVIDLTKKHTRKFFSFEDPNINKETLVELRARFDEAANIHQSRALERAGAHVVYGFLDLKTHAKISIVVRKEGRKLVSYTHFGTGNYHPITANFYTDLSFFTKEPDLARDATKVFNYVSGYIEPSEFENISLAPIDLKKTILQNLLNEVRLAKQGKPARAWIKLNSLVEKDVIDAMYDASNAGVRIDLIVRGICALRPGIKGLSENIRVKSIVGRFLEHSRIACFGNGSDLPSFESRVYISSADWMSRNLNRRVEVLVKINNNTVKAQIVNQIMAANLRDQAQSWVLQSDGSYIRDNIATQNKFSCHDFFMQNPSLSGRGRALRKNPPELLIEN